MRIIFYLILIFITVGVAHAQNCPNGYTPDMDQTYCCHSGADAMPFENSGYCCWSSTPQNVGYGWADNVCCWNGVNDTIAAAPPANFDKTNGRCLNYGTEQPTPGGLNPRQPENLRIATYLIF